MKPAPRAFSNGRHLTPGARRDSSAVAGKWRNVVAKVVFAGVASIAFAASASIASAGEPTDAILKIYATEIVSDYAAPWRSGAAHTVSGSGFVVAGGRILTNAHVVSDATFVQVRRHGESERFAARVLHVSHDSDLALLTVDEPGFFDSITPLSLGGLPELREEVLVLGFPNTRCPGTGRRTSSRLARSRGTPTGATDRSATASREPCPCEADRQRGWWTRGHDRDWTYATGR